jgi:hypothetical protein
MRLSISRASSIVSIDSAWIEKASTDLTYEEKSVYRISASLIELKKELLT